MSDTAHLINLAAPRTVVFNDRGHAYTYTLGPISGTQWKKYFDGIISTAETVDKNIVNTYDNSTASADLVRSTVNDVAGYAIPGGGSLTEQENWKAMLPIAHLLTVAANLRAVERVDTDQPTTLGTEMVALSAIWGVSADGLAMTRKSGLVHRFTPPTIDHQRRYDRDRNRSIIIGGSRTGKTKWLGAQATLIQIYDELIVSVEGYSFGDATPEGDKLKWTMDAYHKVAAAEGLFAQAVVDEQEVTA